MSKGNKGKIKMKCQRGGHGFFANPDETWKFLCPDCYKKYYVPLSKTHSYEEIKNNLDALYEEYRKKQLALSDKQAEEYENDGYYFDWVEVKC
ncbi:hypothetical protein G3N56_16275 [Desulfovibrio sulfodismutans]|uniref:Uncharacterized protein n=1 Tax=Desulfolutivibrio sulfodismutans TaxID=63561 RepID=A0A7K3NQ20_9BACT|nr:hypothetical protein [Desulfolutivibrio sulfodismutans]NDY58290.1 hypothetical protein [Desulfolutivibrio sulfodismutans]QLA12633.1 hypothetical protein GD606_10295 [Desulfolutivibrio sulfodismutans DSM 3696]